MRETSLRKLRYLVAAGCALLGLLSCGEPQNPNDYPLSHWLKDNEDCTRASAAAIIRSGLPFPNFSAEAVAGAASGIKAEQQIKTVDMWLGATRFVVPVRVVRSNGAYPRTHPLSLQALSGTLPEFYPPGPAGEEIDGMGSMVDVNLKCSMDANYAITWGQGNRSNADGIEAMKAEYERQLLQSPEYPGRVTVNRRDDIGMTEVLLDRYSEANGQRSWEASYWPIRGELKSPDGSVSGIGCQIRHDPIKHRYGGRGWRCGGGVRLTPQGGAHIEIYVSHIQQFPTVFEQVRQLLIRAQHSSKE